MSELKVNKISPRSGTDVTLGDSGDTFTVPAGATLSNLGTASGFGLTWQSVQTTGFTAVKGNAYPCDTTSAGFTVTLPATPSAGDQVQLVDYAGTFDTNALIIDPNGEDIEGGTDNLQLTGEREGVILTYIDSTQGWIATSGINEGTDALEPATLFSRFFSNSWRRWWWDDDGGGGGGAGGYRNSFSTEPSGGGGSSEASLTFTGTVYTITVGAGAAGNSTGGHMLVQLVLIHQFQEQELQQLHLLVEVWWCRFSIKLEVQEDLVVELEEIGMVQGVLVHS
jgi:hypothetical protein